KHMRKNLIDVLLTGALLCAFAAAAQARALPADVTLGQFLDLVRVNNIALQAERTQVEVAEADVLEARTLPNPAASYSRQRSEKGYFIEQPLPIFGQRGARIASARQGVEAARERAGANAQEVLRAASFDFAELLIAQEREKRLQEARLQLQ